eukprot:scaffold1558_cov403-Prasinococcus_capsulatus_cf.AAC.45
MCALLCLCDGREAAARLCQTRCGLRRLRHGAKRRCGANGVAGPQVVDRLRVGRTQLGGGLKGRTGAPSSLANHDDHDGGAAEGWGPPQLLHGQEPRGDRDRTAFCTLTMEQLCGVARTECSQKDGRR